VKPQLKLGISQHLSLTPQLKQAIRLLQLSAMELEQEINEALESNPLLEPGQEEEGEAAPESPAETASETAEAETAEAPSEEAKAEESLDVEDWDVAAERDWEKPSGPAPDRDAEPIEARTAAPESLRDYLEWQINLTPLTDRDRAIATAVIDAVGEDGYLRGSLEDVQQTLRPEVEASIEEIEAVRHRVQQFDPLGVASVNLRDCLLVQLAQLDPDTPHLLLARTLVADHLEALAKDHGKLAQKLAVEPEDIEAAGALVKSLNPRPGNNFGSIDAEYVVPDAYAYRHDGRWKVRLNPSCQPTLVINQHYERMAAASRDETASYLKGCLQEARWLIKSLRARGETMLKVATCIVRQQSAFLDYGPEAMRPLTLREVANEIGVHESTVSRITTRKYLHTPRGTFEFKHFFSVGLATSEGGEASATAIRAMIRRLVDDENPGKPMSDSAIAGELNRRGIAVARRTVAKYREAMNIPASSDRCRLA
jgi:RNA polymerase sigma-54 factor